MASTTHKITGYRSFSHRGVDYEEEIDITYRYTPGTPASHDDPGSGPTIEFIELDSPPDAPAMFMDVAENILNGWAEDWLAEHEDEAIAAAIHDREAVADDHADFQRRARIDDALTGDL